MKNLATMPIQDLSRLAHAAGWDAGNRAMKARGGKEWDQGDLNAAAREHERIMAAAGVPGYGDNPEFPLD